MSKKQLIGFKTSLPKTIYTDIVGECFGVGPKIELGFTIHYYNNSGQKLYFKLLGSGPTEWSSGSRVLDSLNNGEEAYKDSWSFMDRDTPTSERTEVVTLTLKGYTDAGYRECTT